MIDDNVTYTAVSSSNLHSVGYDEENKNLFIIFKDKKTNAPKSKYVYYHVPPNVYAELMAAPSHGEYHAAHIKNKYSYDQLQM